MDLLDASGQQPTGQAGAIGCTLEKPGTASSGGGGGDTMSRPSLISSLWSIQVQNEGSASDFPMAGCGSQQSLPEILNQTTGQTVYHNGFLGSNVLPSIGQEHRADLCGGPMEFQPVTSNSPMPSASSSSLRPVKSLSDLHTLTAAQIAQTASAMPCPHHQMVGPSDQQQQQSYLGFRRQTETGNYYNILNRQQRDSQICEWLQKLNVGGGEAETSGSESPSQEFYQQQQQQRPHFQRADTTEQ